MAKRYYWLKLKNDFFDSVRIKKLRSIAGGDTYTIIYLKLLLYAIDKDGIIEYEGVEKTICEELALVLDETAEDIGLCINYLSSVGLAEVRTDSITLSEAIANVGSETASTQRSRECRARQKALQCNTNATEVQHLCNVEKEIEKEKELEIEKDIEIDKSKSKSKKRFTPPTLDELQSYISENLFTVDAQLFLDYYESNGWMVGKTHMKDWKATVRNWERRNQEKFAKEQKSTGGWSFDEL